MKNYLDVEIFFKGLLWANYQAKSVEIVTIFNSPQLHIVTINGKELFYSMRYVSAVFARNE